MTSSSQNALISAKVNVASWFLKPYNIPCNLSTHFLLVLVPILCSKRGKWGIQEFIVAPFTHALKTFRQIDPSLQLLCMAYGSRITCISSFVREPPSPLPPIPFSAWASRESGPSTFVSCVKRAPTAFYTKFSWTYLEQILGKINSHISYSHKHSGYYPASE